MKKRLLFVLIGALIACYSTGMVLAQADEPLLRIYGEVANPLNITYSEFQQLPMVSVNSSVVCVGVPPGDLGLNSYVVYTYNWTGVRLKDLLAIIEPNTDAYDIVFRDNTQYSSSIHINETTRDDFLLAIYADGETLTRDQGYPFRVVLPCYWGYKWVKYVERIEITDYDHTGFWENAGYPDNGMIPGCEPVQSNPEVFTTTSMAIMGTGIVLIIASLYVAYRRD